jgi:chemotaxis protein MotB
MSAGPHNRRRRRRDHGDGHEGGDERWLLTYADMITLLMALFIVMWAISSVNQNKFEELKVSLKAAFSGEVLPDQGAILPGGQGAMELPGTPVVPTNPSQPSASFFQQPPSITATLAAAAGEADLESLERVRRQIEEYAAQHGMAGRISTSIDERGLEIRLLTDEVMFDPGSASLKAPSLPLLDHIAQLLSGPEIPNNVRVEGNTDSMPISTAQFPSNWELSTARATAVLQELLHHGVGPGRLSVAGYADQRPVATNATAEGRAANRHVSLVVLRRQTTPGPEGTPIP